MIECESLIGDTNDLGSTHSGIGCYDCARRWRVYKSGPSTASIPMMAKDVVPTRIRDTLRRAWGRVRWRIAAIVAFTGTSTILILCLAIAAFNVVVRRESANVV